MLGTQEASVGALQWWERITLPVWEQARQDGVAPDMELGQATDMVVGLVARASDEQEETLATWSLRLEPWLAGLEADFERFALEWFREHPDADIEGPANAAETLTEQAWRAAYGGAQREIYRGPISRPVWPYLQYLTVGDSRVRPNHRRLHGFTAAADWRGWPAVEPPNGYRCRCRTLPIDYETAKRRGWEGMFPLGTEKLQSFLAAGGPDDGFPKASFQT